MLPIGNGAEIRDQLMEPLELKHFLNKCTKCIHHLKRDCSGTPSSGCIVLLMVVTGVVEEAVEGGMVDNISVI